MRQDKDDNLWIWPGLNNGEKYKVPSLEYSIIAGVYYLRNSFNYLFASKLPQEVSEQQIELLAQIVYENCQTATEISKRLNVSKATVTDLVQRLEKKGYLKRKSSLKDQRVKIISVTAKGKKMTEKVIPQFLGIMKDALGTISHAEKETINKSLMKLFRVVDDARRNTEE